MRAIWEDLFVVVGLLVLVTAMFLLGYNVQKSATTACEISNELWNRSMSLDNGVVS